MLRVVSAALEQVDGGHVVREAGVGVGDDEQDDDIAGHGGRQEHPEQQPIDAVFWQDGDIILGLQALLEITVNLLRNML